jgi:hypothetical protein
VKYYEVTMKYLVTDAMVEGINIGNELSILANDQGLCVKGVGAIFDNFEEISLEEARRRFQVPDDYPSSGPDAVKGRCYECGEPVHWHDAEWIGNILYHGECLSMAESNGVDE